MNQTKEQREAEIRWYKAHRAVNLLHWNEPRFFDKQYYNELKQTLLGKEKRLFNELKCIDPRWDV